MTTNTQNQHRPTLLLSLFFELQDIWNASGYSDAEKKLELAQLEEECVEVYRKKVHEAKEKRKSLDLSLEDKREEIANVQAHADHAHSKAEDVQSKSEDTESMCLFETHPTTGMEAEEAISETVLPTTTSVISKERDSKTTTPNARISVVSELEEISGLDILAQLPNEEGKLEETNQPTATAVEAIQPAPTTIEASEDQSMEEEQICPEEKKIPLGDHIQDDHETLEEVPVAKEKTKHLPTQEEELSSASKKTATHEERNDERSAQPESRAQAQRSLTGFSLVEEDFPQLERNMACKGSRRGPQSRQINTKTRKVTYSKVDLFDHLMH